MNYEIPTNYQPNPVNKLKDQLIKDYTQLEWLQDNHPEELTEKQMKKLNALRKALLKEFPDDYIY